MSLVNRRRLQRIVLRRLLVTVLPGPVPRAAVKPRGGQVSGGGPGLFLQSGRSGVGPGGSPQCGGTLGALAGPHQPVDGTVAQLGNVGVVGHRLERVEEMLGDDLADLLAVVGKRSSKMIGDGEVAALALPARLRVVGDLTEHRL